MLSINDELDATVDRILAIIDAEHCRYERLKGIEEFVLAADQMYTW